MMVSGGARSRVDERVIGAGTAMRFALLLVLLFVTSGHMAQDALSSSGGWGCFLAAGGQRGESLLRGTLLIQHQQRAYDLCEQRFGGFLAPWWVALAIPVAVLAAASVVFLLIPMWKARRGKVVPLDSVDRDGEISRLVSDLAAVSGLDRTPRIVVDPVTSSTGAVVFGRTRRPVVCLHGGLVACRNTDPHRFRAVLLHELAHIRNRDITITYFTVAVWRVFLVCVLVPYAVRYGLVAIGSRSPGDLPYSTRNVLLTVFLIAITYLARSDVLRSREIHADLAAVRWGADPRGWIVPAYDAKRSRSRRAVSSFVELWQTHPRWQLRSGALDDPADLFALRAVPMFLTGAAAGLVFSQLSFNKQVSGLKSTVAGYLGAVSASVLITTVAGIALWRAVVHATATGRPVPTGSLAGLSLGCGLASTEFVIDRAAITKWLPQWPVVLSVVVLFGVMFAWWVIQCGVLWARAWPGQSLRPVMYLILAGSVVGWIAWFGWWGPLGQQYMVGWPLGHTNYSDYLLEQTGGPIAGHTAEWTAISTVTPHLISLTVPVSSIAIGAATLVPLLAWTVAPTRIRPRWIREMFRDSGAADPPRLVPLPTLRTIVVPGLLGGIACWMAAAGVLQYLHMWRPQPGASFGFYAWIYLGWIVVCLLLAMIVAATMASVRTSSCRFVVALAATQVALLVGFAGVFVLMSSEGCFRPLNTLTTVCVWRPKATGSLVEFLLVPIAILGLAIAFMTAAAASAVLAIRPARTRVRSAPRRVPVTVVAVRNRRLAVGVVVTALTALGAVPVFAPNHESADDRSGVVVKDPAATPVSPEIRTEEIKAWFLYGGKEYLDRIFSASDRLFALLQGLPESGEADISPLADICNDLEQTVREATEYFDLPDPDLGLLWRRFLTLADNSSGHCRRVIQQLNSDDLDPQLFRTLSAELGTALSEIGDALELFSAVTDRILLVVLGR
ncbi:M48 family metallopeptidase [Nocardia vinacea]|uniref:M48 family metallopeptidase n=1 Tax=Nocardia vinacea TaxID=96468 RepID=UPI000A06D18F|nr:M48 family metalloprotease [Nocardia vinacea]